MLSNIVSVCGSNSIGAFHLNDSKVPFGIHRDRHANIGEGCISEEEFIDFFRESLPLHVPYILETPGFDRSGPDHINVNQSKKIMNIALQTYLP